MTTTLYLITIHTWYTFTIFDGASQMQQCLTMQRGLERRFAVEAICVSRTTNKIIINNKIYER